MPLRTVHLINTTLDDTLASIAGSHRFQGAAPKRATLFVQMVETASANDASIALTVEVSPDEGATLITYDKLITDAGVDAPVASVTYSTTEDDIVSLSPEDVMNYIQVTLTGTAVDASDFYAVDVWLVYDY
ncbi:hypothetical protein LCGC14_2633540 [marine sediment metagenome]|uniref:Uncharacterized protein n=1 Tax=marine sediment metagenome TaxID=412755 RepID=A0A0F8ZZT4_9ZZZZ